MNGGEEEGKRRGEVRRGERKIGTRELFVHVQNKLTHVDIAS